jgi:hypothetical protein
VRHGKELMEGGFAFSWGTLLIGAHAMSMCK